MYWSKSFIPTMREIPQEAESASHQLMLRAGLIRMLMAGAYSYLPLGLKVLNNIQNIIREEMNNSGANELLLPALQPLDLWQKTGRDKVIGEVMIRFVDRRGRNICLGPTHEEVITDLVRQHVSSYKQLPLILYQIQTKFRDEIRPRFGLVRACEFIMKDAYSFDADEAGLDKNYSIMREAYKRIFKRCGLACLSVEADSGVMGGKVSHEFMVPSACGEDVVLVCPKCKTVLPYPVDKAFHDILKGKTSNCPKCQVGMEKVNTIEVGHIFKLGTKYSEGLGANFLDAKGVSNPVIMGCYGIGVSRLVSTIIEQNHDQQGIIWPLEITPYDVLIIPLDVTNEQIIEKAKSIYNRLSEQQNIKVLLDDRDERAGVKFKDADLIGIPYQVVIGKEFLKTGNLELKIRRTGEKFSGGEEEVLKTACSV
ncbi:MAG: proline--tRNA ligase [Candidatus Omnitrophota bacterium]